MPDETGMPAPQSVRYEPTTPAVVIHGLLVVDPAVVAESRNWSEGRRGLAVTSTQMLDADLSAFVLQALAVGARAITIAGGVQETFNIEGLIAEVGDRTTAASKMATKATKEVMAQATATMQAAAEDAKRAIAEAATIARQAFAQNVSSASDALTKEFQRLVGGESPELLQKLTPVLDKFARELQERTSQQTSTLIDRVARQFDPADPTSPISQHTRELTRQQTALSDTLARHQHDLETKVDELTTAIKVGRAAETGTRKVIDVTPIKGERYAEGIHRVMNAIASGLGDEYSDPSGAVGLISRSKKGDGLLAIAGGDVRVVLEMSDSNAKRRWSGYLDEAERNRGALASLGLVPTPDQLRGSSFITLGPRRIVMAFDPDSDDPALLRTVVQLLRLAAQAASVQQDSGEVHAAEEKIAAALTLLGKIDNIKKTAGLIRQHASKIDEDSETLRTELSRLLTQAKSVLSGVDGQQAAHEAA